MPRTSAPILGREITTPANPPANSRLLYPKSDGWYQKTGGVETKISDSAHTHAAPTNMVTTDTTQTITGAKTFTGPKADAWSTSGLIPGVAPSRFVGYAPAAGSPGTGTWQSGDWMIDQSSRVLMCETGGTPGTWKVHTHPEYNPPAWQDFTLQWTAATNPTIGNGSIDARYCQIGDTVHVSITIVFGSTTTKGSGTYSFWGYPTPRFGSDSVGTLYMSGGTPNIAGGTFRPNAVDGVYGRAHFYSVNAGDMNGLTATSPPLGGAGTRLLLTATYEAM